MTPQQIFATALRLFAVWLFLNSLRYLVLVPQALFQDMHGRGVGTSLITGGIILAMALVVWFFPLWLAHKFVPRTQFENHLNLQPLQAAQVGCALIGLWYFSKGMLSVSWYVLIFATTDTWDSGFGSLPSDEKATFIYALIEVALALTLMLRGATFARLVVREAKA